MKESPEELTQRAREERTASRIEMRPSHVILISEDEADAVYEEYVLKLNRIEEDCSFWVPFKGFRIAGVDFQIVRGGDA